MICEYEKFISYCRDEVNARANGTTYGELKVPKKTVQAPTCKFAEFGCPSTGGHKTAQAKTCKYHLLYKSLQGNKNRLSILPNF